MKSTKSVAARNWRFEKRKPILKLDSKMSFLRKIYEIYSTRNVYYIIISSKIFLGENVL